MENPSDDGDSSKVRWVKLVMLTPSKVKLQMRAVAKSPKKYVPWRLGIAQPR